MASKTSRQILGQRGEDVAARFLEQKGMKIIARNYRAEHGEIDIIVLDGNTLAFVEVKTSKSKSFGPPQTWINEKKQQNLAQTAEAFLYQNNYENYDCRFDVVALEKKGENFIINHIKDAFWLQ